jgi:hypothetical protein
MLYLILPWIILRFFRAGLSCIHMHPAFLFCWCSAPVALPHNAVMLENASVRLTPSENLVCTQLHNITLRLVHVTVVLCMYLCMCSYHMGSPKLDDMYVFYPQAGARGWVDGCSNAHILIRFTVLL